MNSSTILQDWCAANNRTRANLALEMRVSTPVIYCADKWLATRTVERNKAHPLSERLADRLELITKGGVIREVWGHPSPPQRQHIAGGIDAKTTAAIELSKKKEIARLQADLRSSSEPELELTR